jgi:hypothetical protein
VPMSWRLSSFGRSFCAKRSIIWDGLEAPRGCVLVGSWGIIFFQ